MSSPLSVVTKSPWVANAVLSCAIFARSCLYLEGSAEMVYLPVLFPSAWVTRRLRPDGHESPTQFLSLLVGHDTLSFFVLWCTQVRYKSGKPRTKTAHAKDECLLVPLSEYVLYQSYGKLTFLCAGSITSSETTNNYLCGSIAFVYTAANSEPSAVASTIATLITRIRFSAPST